MAHPIPGLFGRSSSHFSRVTRLVAAEFDVAYQFQPVYDLGSRDRRDYGGNPAMKLPVLRLGDASVFGTENIARVLADRAKRPVRMVWTEHLPDLVARNAQELVWHAMAAQVQLVFGTQAAGLPAENLYFMKASEGMAQVLEWLDLHLDEVLASLPARDLSLLEVTLFCLIEHLAFRPTVPLLPYTSLTAYADRFGQRASARNTVYHFDRPPA